MLWRNLKIRKKPAKYSGEFLLDNSQGRKRLYSIIAWVWSIRMIGTYTVTQSLLMKKETIQAYISIPKHFWKLLKNVMRYFTVWDDYQDSINNLYIWRLIMQRCLYFWQTEAEGNGHYNLNKEQDGKHIYKQLDVYTFQQQEKEVSSIHLIQENMLLNCIVCWDLAHCKECTQSPWLNAHVSLCCQIHEQMGFHTSLGCSPGGKSLLMTFTCSFQYT